MPQDSISTTLVNQLDCYQTSTYLAW